MTVRQAHRYLLALARQQRPDWRDYPRAALHWLEDRQLIAPYRGAQGLEYVATRRGVQAVLGRAAA